MDIFEFHQKLRDHCQTRTPEHDPDLSKGCLYCCFRLYCWTATSDKNETLIAKVIEDFDNPIDRANEFNEEVILYLAECGEDKAQDKDMVHRAYSRRCIYDPIENIP